MLWMYLSAVSHQALFRREPPVDGKIRPARHSYGLRPRRVKDSTGFNIAPVVITSLLYAAIHLSALISPQIIHLKFGFLLIIILKVHSDFLTN